MLDVFTDTLLFTGVFFCVLWFFFNTYSLIRGICAMRITKRWMQKADEWREKENTEMLISFLKFIEIYDPIEQMYDNLTVWPTYYNKLYEQHMQEYGRKKVDTKHLVH